MAFLSFPWRLWIWPFGRHLLCLAVLLLPSVLQAQAPNVEYRIKAAYMFNFAKFVSWPSTVFATSNSAIVIGILGKDPFGSEIDQTIAGKTIEGRPLQIKRFSDSDALEGAHILFVASSERRRVPEILKQLGKAPVLTVGEMEEFTDVGGMIRFLKMENNIRLEVNLEHVKAAGLKISSKLLGVATVKGSPNR